MHIRWQTMVNPKRIYSILGLYIKQQKKQTKILIKKLILNDQLSLTDHLTQIIISR